GSGSVGRSKASSTVTITSPRRLSQILMSSRAQPWDSASAAAILRRSISSSSLLIRNSAMIPLQKVFDPRARTFGGNTNRLHGQGLEKDPTLTGTVHTRTDDLPHRS